MTNFYLHGISSLSPFLLPIVGGLTWVFTGEFFWIYLASNTIIFGEFLNVLIKKFFKSFLYDEPWALRPDPCAPCNNFMTPVVDKQSVYNFGFPSGHSQNVGVFCGMLICYFLFTTKNGGLKAFITFLFSMYVGWSRIQLGCHNLIQVSTGLLIGYFLGINLWRFYTFFSPKKNL